MRDEDHKNFLRCCVKEDGSLEINVIGVDKSPKRWKQNDVENVLQGAPRLVPQGEGGTGKKNTLAPKLVERIIVESTEKRLKKEGRGIKTTKKREKEGEKSKNKKEEEDEDEEKKEDERKKEEEDEEEAEEESKTAVRRSKSRGNSKARKEPKARSKSPAYSLTGGGKGKKD